MMVAMDVGEGGFEAGKRKVRKKVGRSRGRR